MYPEPTPQNSQETVNLRLAWACDLFRDAHLTEETTNHVLVLYYLKLVSDMVSDRSEASREQNDAATPAPTQSPAIRLVLPEGARFSDLYDASASDDLDALINRALIRIESANAPMLAGVASAFDFTSEAILGAAVKRNSRLRVVFEELSDPALDLGPHPFGSEDALGAAYEYLSSRDVPASSDQRRHYFPAPGVRHLIARLVQPKQGDRIVDIACGAGSLLIECAERVRAQGGNVLGVYGHAETRSTWALAKLNLAANGLGDTTPDHTDDAPLRDGGQASRYDVVVASPRFSVEADESGHQPPDLSTAAIRSLPRTTTGDLEHIRRMVDVADPVAGRVCALVPSELLTTRSSDRLILQQLIEENVLDAVIDLPPKLFIGIQQATVALVCRRNKADDSVLFIDASDDYYEYGTHNGFNQQDIVRISSAYERREAVDEYCKLVSLSDIRDRTYDLNRWRYAAAGVAPKSLRSLKQILDTTTRIASRAADDVWKRLRDLGFDG